jgi:hypothetical protein
MARVDFATCVAWCIIIAVACHRVDVVDVGRASNGDVYVSNVRREEMEVEKMRKTISFLTGLLAGAVVGATAVILLAPTSGSEMQERLRSRVQELIDEGKQAAAARRAELETQLEAFKRGTPAAAETAPE